MTALARINLNYELYKTDKLAHKTQQFSDTLAQLYLDGVISESEYNASAALYRATYQS